jgi:hypothetical protein
LQAFDNRARLSAGTHIQIFGQNLSETTRQWAEADFQQGRAPTSLDGVRVNVNGRPARPGETIILFAVGCGPSNPPLPAGQKPSQSLPLALPFEFRIGNVAAPAQGVVLAPFLGLYQFNVTVPDSVPDGDAPIELTVDGQPTGQTLFVAVRR